ncbi:MAG TPA: hypothetical protein VJZ93_02045 [Candidatus Nanoarchaeia archaeon]|nr:hypothetical protein [Candidatus Nanoarchaeia archaeon]
MTFKVEYSNQSQKFLKKSNKLVTRRIISKIDKLRIGDYRALIDIDFENKILIIQVFDKRGKIYK